MAVQVQVSPTAPAQKDGVLITVRGAVPEGSTIRVTSATAGANTAISPTFGLSEIPEGTGAEAINFKITGGVGGTFTLTVRDPDITDPDIAPVYYTTDPIYYDEDAPTYAYPDEDTVAAELMEALPDGVDVTTHMWGNQMTIFFGGKWSGKNLSMTCNSSAVLGTETVTIADVTKVGGPYQFGPLFLNAGVYSVDVKNSSSVSVLGSPVAFTVT